LTAFTFVFTDASASNLLPFGYILIKSNHCIVMISHIK
jgi:hypothetical protein